ncbi:VPLPA-CTERM sorting domain-containing protein [Paraglaciecola sp.]|uniref:VPLPA-CTERM sorting domain-containing protein n=1 Tax=Paraglaciecola sp. TaxID=1920173 RepID=UPI003EF88471
MYKLAIATLLLTVFTGQVNAVLLTFNGTLDLRNRGGDLEYDWSQQTAGFTGAIDFLTETPYRSDYRTGTDGFIRDEAWYEYSSFIFLLDNGVTWSHTGGYADNDFVHVYNGTDGSNSNTFDGVELYGRENTVASNGLVISGMHLRARDYDDTTFDSSGISSITSFQELMDGFWYQGQISFYSPHSHYGEYNVGITNIAFDPLNENPVPPVAQSPVTSVPAPASAWLFLSALIGFAGIKRKK